MSSFGRNSQGLDLKPRAVSLTMNRLTRVIEMEFLCSDPAVKASAKFIRPSSADEFTQASAFME